MARATSQRQPPVFDRYVGIDYSGAETPTSSLKALRVFQAEREAPPVEVPPSPGAKKFWTRLGIAEWLVTRLSEQPPTLVGIDHGFSFPLRYFETHWLPPDWPSFLDQDQQDAYAVAAWMRRTDLDGHLAEYFQPELTPEEQAVAGVEGWILGVR